MYFVAWGTYARDVQVADIDGSKLTHINYAFANVSPDGMCVLGDPYADVQKTFTAENSVDGVADTWDQSMAGNFNQLRKLKIKYPNVKTLISLGGWTWSDKFSAMAMTAAGREKFVDSCLIFMETYGFDGIDVDWEYPAKKGDSNNYRSEDRDNFTELLKEFRKKLDATGVHHPLTLATSATLVDVSYDVAAIHPYLDFINVMTYDFAGSWQKSTGHNAPLNTPRGAINKSGFIASLEDWNRQGCPKDKLVGGLGYYGRSWGNVVSDVVGAAANGPGYGSWENGVVDYKDIKNNGWETGSDGWVKHWDDQAMVPYIYNSGTKQFISYDDEESICAKISWLKANGYKGGMAWDLSGDDGSLQGLTYDVLVGGETCGSGFWTQSMLKSWKAGDADYEKIGGMDKNVVYAVAGVGGMLVVGALVGGFVVGRASNGESRPMKAEGVEIVDKAMV